MSKFICFLLLINLGSAYASGSESSSGGNSKEKDSSREEMRSSMRERLRAKRLEGKKDRPKDEILTDENKKQKSKEEM